MSNSKQTTLQFDKSFNLFDQSISCPASGDIPAFTGEVKADVEAKLNGTVNYGIIAAGTIVPPALSEFGLFANFDATLDGILTIDTTATVRAILL